jgi:hypothetical protein
MSDASASVDRFRACATPLLRPRPAGPAEVSCGGPAQALACRLSAAADALPVAVASAGLAGFDPVVGLYRSFLRLGALADFHQSRSWSVSRMGSR